MNTYLSTSIYYSTETYNYADLDAMGFDDRFRSACVTGVWIFYDYVYYEGNSWYAWGVNDNCFNMDDSIAGKASSVRFGGIGEGMDRNAISVYGKPWFAGLTEVYIDDAYGVFQYKQGSLIVTGCEPWTLEDGSAEKCACVYPSDTSNCYPGMYPNLDLGFNYYRLKKGCSCRTKLYPEPAQIQTQNGAISWKI